MKLTAFLEGIGIGAVAMYLADPEGGNRRRAMIRDQVVSQTNRKREALDVMTRDFSNRARGLQHKVQGKMGDVSSMMPEGGVSGMKMPTGEDVTNLFKEKWSPSTSLMMGASGLFMILYGMGKKGMVGGLMQTGGVAMIVKAFHDTETRFDQPENSNNVSMYPNTGGQPQFSGEDMEGEPVTDRGQAGML